MKKLLLLPALLLISFFASAQQNIQVHSGGNIMYQAATSAIDSITFNSGYSLFNLNDSSTVSLPIAETDSITFSATTAAQNKIYIIYNDDQVTIINPFSTQGITITASSANVTAVAASGIDDVEYNILGTSTNGTLSLASDKNVQLIINNLHLTNPSGAAFNLTGGITANVYLTDGTENSLSDGTASSKNATLLSDGALIFSGSGTMEVSGLKKHGISASSITVNDGAITIATAASDGFHSEGFVINGGSVDVTSTGDGIDSGETDIALNGGVVTVTSTSDDVKAIKTDGAITVGDAVITVDVSGAQSKGFSADGTITINGGDIEATVSGATVLEAAGSGYDPSYATALKAGTDIVVNSGTLNLTLTSTSGGGKGLSADGNISILGGTVTVTTAGAGATYTDENGAAESYTASCIKADGNINLTAGTVNCSSTGKGGKGISADGVITIGATGANDDLLYLTVGTSGARFLVSGTGENADYANPKAVTCEGNLVLNSGTVTINCTQTASGGEGLESKATLTINGGTTEIDTYDDAINASTAIVINGGTTYAHARGNDGIDSNGTININGGFTIASGAASPEEGFDCDNNTFTVTGGTFVGVGGSTSNPTASVSTQRTIKFTAAQNANVCIKNAAGDALLLFTVPTVTSTGGGGQGGGSSNLTLIFGDPDVAAGSYTIQKGGTLTGGTDFHGYNTGGTYSGGTSTSFTVSSMLTTVN